MMGSQRSDKDSWVHRDASRRVVLIYDPYAELLVAAAGTGVWEHIVDDTVLGALAKRDPELAAVIEHLRSYQAVRTHFFDRFFANAVSAAITQMVILGSGLDTRAYRLPWPRGSSCMRSTSPRCCNSWPKHLPGMGSHRP